MSTQPQPPEQQTADANPIINLDPTMVLHVAKIMVAEIYGFGRNFAESSTPLLAEFGERIRPYLEQGWMKAQELIAEELAAVSRPRIRDE